LRSERETDVLVQDGYATAELDDELTHRLRGAEPDPVLAVAAHVARYLHERDLDQVRIVAARSGRTSTILTLEASLSIQARLFDALDELGPHIGVGAEAVLSADHDILLKLTGVRKLRLLGSGVGSSHAVPWLTELGVLYSRQILFVDWRALHHALVAGLQGQGAETILTSLLATLTARQRPSDLRLWMIAPPRLLPAPLARLPHLVRPPAVPDDGAGVTAIIDAVRVQLEARLAAPPETVRHAPELALVVGELADLDPHAEALHLIGSHGPSYGVRLLAATSAPEGLHSPLLPHFTTRLVLQTQDEEASMAVLGSSDAAFLGGGGRLLLRLDAREPVELYGYRVALEHLERLVRVMREAYAPEFDTRPSTPPEPDGASATDTSAATGTADSVPGFTRIGASPETVDELEPTGAGQEAAPQMQTPSAERVPKRSLPHVPLDGESSEAPSAMAAPDSPSAPDYSDHELHPSSDVQNGRSPLSADPALMRDGTDAIDQTRLPPNDDSPADRQPATEPPMDTLSLLRTAPYPSQSGSSPVTASPSSNGALLHGAEVATERIDGGASTATPVVASTRTPLYVQCFGGPKVLYHGEHVWPAGGAGDSKPWELLLYLSAQPAEGVAREVVTEAFWPSDERDVEVGHRLRQLRYRLRTVLERSRPSYRVR
jgi:hypothetical protein